MRVLFSVCSTDLGLDLRPGRAFAAADSEISQQFGRWEQWTAANEAQWFPRVRKCSCITGIWEALAQWQSWLSLVIMITVIAVIWEGS